MQELTLETAVSILMFQDGILRFIFALSGCVAFGFKFKPVAWLTGCTHRIAAGPYRRRCASGKIATASARSL